MLKSATFRCGSQDPIPSITDGLLLFELSPTRIALLRITTEPPERSDTGLPSSAQCTISLNRKNLKKPRWKSEPTVISKSEIPPPFHWLPARGDAYHSNSSPNFIQKIFRFRLGLFLTRSLY